jgi:hypothetical protein
MKLIQQIEVARVEFSRGFARGPVQPTKLFLGRQEWEAARHIALTKCGFVMTGGDGADRPEYRGMKIYQMDDECYLEVGR